MHPARTMVFGPSHWHFPLCADRIAARHTIVGVIDDDLQVARLYAAQWDSVVYDRWQDLIDANRDAELAYVFVAHDQMKEICLALIEARIPLVVEKPAGVSREQVEQIRAAAEAAQVPITVPLVQRGGPAELWLSQAGPALYESTQFIAGPPHRYRENGNPWMVESVRAGGGCLLNLAPHFIDMFMRSTGHRAPAVSGVISAALHGNDVEDFASIILTTPAGEVGTIQVGYAFPNSPLKRYCSFTRIGPNGTASISSDGRASFTSVDGMTRTDVLDVDSDTLYGPFIDAVADSLGDGFQGLASIGDLEDAMSVVWDVYEAEGRAT